MRQQKYLLLLFISILFSCMQCKEEESYPAYHMDQEFKDNVVFPEGSYWIYEDSASGDVDSVYLISQRTYMYKGNKKVPYNMEVSDLEFSSTENNSLIGGTVKTDEEAPYAYNLHKKNSIFTFSSYFFSIENKTIGSKYNNLVYLKSYNSYNILNKTFYNVKVFQSDDSTLTTHPKKLFYSPGKGLIRKELFNGQVWNLINYYINN